MAEGSGEQVTNHSNGVDEPMDTTDGKGKSLSSYGLDEKVIAKLEELFSAGKLSLEELDDRALAALKEFPADGAITVLKEFMDSNLEHVSNKSAYLCGIMKTFRQKSKLGAQVASSKGPDDDKIKAILDRTGYSLDVTTGQRKYGGPPPEWGDKASPGIGCEVFVGKIPRLIFEDELIPVFEKCGTIYDLRLMMDPLTGNNRGYAFITFVDKESAQAAVKQLNNYEIKNGKNLKVNISVPNLRLFVGNIPKSKGREEILGEFTKLTGGIQDVIIYSSPDDKRKNRGFCFLEYESHKAASLGKRKLGAGRLKVWGCDIIVDWADPQDEPDEETMAKVKVLYIRNLTAETTEEKLHDIYDPYGKIDRIKKIKDYAFVHFTERDSAVKAMEETHNTQMAGATVEVSLAKPPSDKKKKEEVLRNRERRMMMTMTRGGGMGAPSPGRGGRGARMPPPMGGPRGYGDYDYDYYGGGGGGYGDFGHGGGYGDPYYDDYYGGGPQFDDYGYDYDYGYPTPPRPFPGRMQNALPPPDRVSRTPRSGPPRGRPRGGGESSRGMGGMGRHNDRSPGMGRGGGKQFRGNMAGKRKFDSGPQNQGASKRRLPNSRGGGNNWGSQPIPQQPHMADEWYQDSYGSQQWG